MRIFLLLIMVIWLSMRPVWAAGINVQIDKKSKRALDKIFPEYDNVSIDSFNLAGTGFGTNEISIPVDEIKKEEMDEEEEIEEEIEEPIVEDFARFIKVYLSGELLGFIYCGIEYGKHQNIYFSVGFDKMGKVNKVVITDAGSIRSRKVNNRRFLRQFRGKSVKNKLRFNMDISGITGATISSRAMTRGVRRATKLWINYYNKKYSNSY